MAISTQSLLSRLNPLSAIDVSGLSGGETSMQRKQLKLAREQFEETKRQNAEQAELRRISEAGEMTRAKMLDERQRAQQEAQAQAETLKQRRAAHDDMLKYRDTGDYEGMEGAANRLNELGGLAERLGEDEHGLPTWHIELDAEKYKKEQAALERQQAPGAIEAPGYTTPEGDQVAPDESSASSLSRLNALGYPGTDRGTLNPPAGIGSSDDLTPEQIARVTGGGSQQRAATDAAVAQAPLEVERDIGPPMADADPAEDTSPIKPEYRQAPQGLDPLAALRPARLGPVPAAPADIMGGVPKNVIDTGAMNAQAQRRLGPVMANIEASMPAGAYRDAAKNNNAAAAAAGLPVDKTLDLSLKLRTPADAAIAREREHEFDVEKAEAARDKPLTRPELEGLAGKGYKKAEGLYTKDKIPDALDRIASAETVHDILSNRIKADDKMVVFNVTRLLRSIGPQSDNDLKAALGLDSMSAKDRVVARFQELWRGGMSDEQKDAILGIVERSAQDDDELVYSYLDKLDATAAAESDPKVREGWELYRKTIPQKYRDEVDSHKKKDQAEPGSTATPVSASVDDDEDGDDFDTALDSAADDHGLDADNMRTVIGPESGGKGDAKNKGSSASGIIQMIDSTAQRYVNPKTGKKFANGAELRELSPAEQAPIAAQYFHDSGVTADSPPEDYALAVAAPAFVGKSADRDAVVYRKGSDEYEANKPWQPKDGGDITVGSILDFYIKKKKGDAETPASSKPAAGGQDAARKKLLEGI